MPERLTETRLRLRDWWRRLRRLPHISGTWSGRDLRRAFVAGAEWWEYHKTDATMWASDRHLAEDEAERRHPGGHLRPPRA